MKHSNDRSVQYFWRRGVSMLRLAERVGPRLDPDLPSAPEVDAGYCLDAVTMMPAGSMANAHRNSAQVTASYPILSVVDRDEWRYA